MISCTVTRSGVMYHVVVWRHHTEKVYELYVDQHMVNGWEGAIVHTMGAMTADPRLRIKL